MYLCARYREDQLEEDMEDADMYNAIRQFLYVKNWPWSEDVKWATNVAPDQKQITAFRSVPTSWTGPTHRVQVQYILQHLSRST